MATPSAAAAVMAASTPNLTSMALSSSTPGASTSAAPPNLTPQVHLILLLPALGDAPVPPPTLLQSLHSRLRIQHPGARVMASSVTYATSTSRLTAPPVRRAWIELQADAVGEQAAEELESLVGRNTEESFELKLDGLDEEGTQKADIVSGLVAALEHFASFAPLPLEMMPASLEPPRATVLARHLLHFCSTPLDLDLTSSGAIGTAQHALHDSWGLAEAVGGLKGKGISCSTLILPGAVDAAKITADAQAVHTQLGVEHDDTISEEEMKALLIPAAVLPPGGKLLLRGLSSTIVSASLVRKRSRSKAADSLNPSSAAAAAGDGGDAKRRKANVPVPAPAPPSASIDATARTLLGRVLFLQQQVGMMMTHLSLAARKDGVKESGKDVPIEKLRQKLGGLRQAFQAQYASLAGGGTAPELNSSIAQLLAINNEAAQLGIELGLRAAAAQAGGHGAAANPVAPVAGSSTAQPGGTVPVAASSRAHPCWQGPLCWQVTDPSSGMKREIQTVVTATASVKTASMTSMGLPWPDRLEMRNTIPLDMPSLQALGARNTPCVLFGPRPPPGHENDAARITRNEEAYKSFGQMLDSRKLCGFIPWKTEAGAARAGGILIVATPTPSTSTGGIRLFGLVFHEFGPIKQLIDSATVAANARKQQQVAATAQNGSTGQASATATPATATSAPPQALFQAMPTPNASQPTPQSVSQQQMDVQRQLAMQMRQQQMMQQSQMHQQQQMQQQMQQQGRMPVQAQYQQPQPASFANANGLPQQQPQMQFNQQGQAALASNPAGNAWAGYSYPNAAAQSGFTANAAQAAPFGAGGAQQNWAGAGVPGVGAADVAALAAQLGLSMDSQQQPQNMWGTWSGTGASSNGNTSQQQPQAGQPDFAMLQRMLNGQQ